MGGVRELLRGPARRRVASPCDLDRLKRRTDL
jgi:hypothetical protein